MKNGHAHGPEAMRVEREQHCRCDAKQVDRQMTSIERSERRRNESVKQLVGRYHRQCDRRHCPFGAAAAPKCVACGNG